jgi:dynein heavy chain
LYFCFQIGGRVTDDWDRRCVANILDDFYASKVLDPNYCYDESQIYHQLPPTSEHQAYVAYVRSLPINDTPEIFGLHDNANSKSKKLRKKLIFFNILLVTFAQNETYRTLRDLLELQPKTASAGENRDLVIEKLAKDVLSRVPQPIPLASVMEKYPVMYEQVKNLAFIYI